MSTMDNQIREQLKRLTISLEWSQRRLREVEEKAHEPIAIVGMACRYPGDVRSPDELWDLLKVGREIISELPTNRGWDVAAPFDSDPTGRNTSGSPRGAFIHDADLFDARFFGMTPTEALMADPEQRLLL